MVVTSRVLALLAITVLFGEIAEKGVVDDISFRYVGQGTNSAGVFVALFDVNRLSARNNIILIEVIVLDEQGVPFKNTKQKSSAFGRLVNKSADPFRMTLEVPIPATTNAWNTNAWQLQVHFASESLLAQALGTVTSMPAAGKARGWPYDQELLSSVVPPKRP